VEAKDFPRILDFGKPWLALVIWQRVFSSFHTLQRGTLTVVLLISSGRGAMADLNAASRFEKSLGLLTTRFVNLLQEARDGVLDLKVVSTSNKYI
jgi:hypothetical protein